MQWQWVLEVQQGPASAPAPHTAGLTQEAEGRSALTCLSSAPAPKEVLGTQGVTKSFPHGAYV